MASATSEADTPIRDAATLILVKSPSTQPSILMGQRQRGAVFMPGKSVFPGGAVDPEDIGVELGGALSATCDERLSAGGCGPASRFAAAAIRELWEETGLAYAFPGELTSSGPVWDAFRGRGLKPSATGLTFIYRAITPPGRSRRFDARFFVADAARLIGNTEDFSGASGELSHLAWVPIDRIGELDLAPVTRAVLRFLLPRLPDLGPPEDVPLRS